MRHSQTSRGPWRRTLRAALAACRLLRCMMQRLPPSISPHTAVTHHTQVALVTAATAGIGLGIARRLGQEGASVFICSRCGWLRGFVLGSWGCGDLV